MNESDEEYIKKGIRKINRALSQRGSNKYLRNITGLIHIGANTGQERNLYKK